jgi:putative FmdB family regulatory protein
MPIYEYKCKSCGQTAEIMTQTFNNPPVPKCPACGEEMQRRLSSPALVTVKNSQSGRTCCGREERCEKPPCSGGAGNCHRH